jgi:hypothetical protein
MIIPTNIGNDPLTQSTIVPVKTVQLKMNNNTVGQAKPPMYLVAIALSSVGVMSVSMTQRIPLA